MSTTINARQVLDFALLQSAAECYFNDAERLSNEEYIRERLTEGANKAELQGEGKAYNADILRGATRLTDTQIDYFLANYEIVTHYPNDASGFSCTLFRNIHTGAYTLSFRSTEYQFQNKGGDYERDGSEGADGDINEYGFALAQLSSMEEFYANLKEGKTYSTVTGQWETNDALLQGKKLYSVKT